MADEWIERFSQSRQRTYYYNERTGESAWVRPASTPAPTDLADEWDEHMDPATQRPYYVNRRSRKSVWVKPTTPAAQAAPVSPAAPTVAAAPRGPAGGRALVGMSNDGGATTSVSTNAMSSSVLGASGVGGTPNWATNTPTDATVPSSRTSAVAAMVNSWTADPTPGAGPGDQYSTGTSTSAARVRDVTEAASAQVFAERHHGTIMQLRDNSPTLTRLDLSAPGVGIVKAVAGSNLGPTCVPLSAGLLDELLDALSTNSTLRELSLQRRAIGGVTLNFMCSVLRPPPSSRPRAAALSSLRVLNLASNKLGDKGVSIMAHALEQGLHITTLDLTDNCITASGAERLSASLRPGIDTCPGGRVALVALDISQNAICDEGCGALVTALALGTATSPSPMRRLVMRAAGIGEFGATSMKDAWSSSPPPPLTSLDISDNPAIGPLGGDNIVALAHLIAGHNSLAASPLETLQCDGCGLKGQQVQSIHAALTGVLASSGASVPQNVSPIAEQVQQKAAAQLGHNQSWEGSEKDQEQEPKQDHELQSEQVKVQMQEQRLEQEQEPEQEQQEEQEREPEQEQQEQQEEQEQQEQQEEQEQQKEQEQQEQDVGQHVVDSFTAQTIQQFLDELELGMYARTIESNLVDQLDELLHEAASRTAELEHDLDELGVPENARRIIVSALLCAAGNTIPCVELRTGDKAWYSHSDGKREIVQVIKAHADDEGGGFTVMLPSTGRERQTTSERLQPVPPENGGGQETDCVDSTAGDDGGGHGGDLEVSDDGNLQDKEQKSLDKDETSSEVLHNDLMALRITRFVRWVGHKKSGRSMAEQLLGAAPVKKKRRGRRASLKGKALTKSMRESMFDGAAVHEGWLEKKSTSRWGKEYLRRYFSLRGHYMKYFLDDRKIEMKGVLDLHSIKRCEMQTEPPLLSLSVGEDGGDLILRAPSADECRVWVKAFLTASPNCQVSFVKSQNVNNAGDKDNKSDADGGCEGGASTAGQEGADVSRADGEEDNGQVSAGPGEGGGQGFEQDELTYDSDDNE